MIRPSVSHNREDESLEAKARWFRSLTVEQRLDVFESFAELALPSDGNDSPLTMDEVTARYVHTPAERIRIIELP